MPRSPLRSPLRFAAAGTAAVLALSTAAPASATSALTSAASNGAPSAAGGARPCAPQSANPVPQAGSAEVATAAAAHGWGEPVWCEDFDDYLEPSDWVLYDSPGHAGNGRRSPAQALLGQGSLFLHGLADGTTAGLATRHSQAYGRWEVRVRLYVGTGSYHPVVLLWPENGGGNVRSATGEEIDFLEVIDDPERMRPNFFLHTGRGQEQAHAQVDMTAWHTYAVETSPNGVVGYLDGREWFRSSSATQSPMSLCLQLDWFPGQGSGGEAWMEVDWVRIYR